MRARQRVRALCSRAPTPRAPIPRAPTHTHTRAPCIFSHPKTTRSLPHAPFPHYDRALYALLSESSQHPRLPTGVRTCDGSGRLPARGPWCTSRRPARAVAAGCRSRTPPAPTHAAGPPPAGQIRQPRNCGPTRTRQRPGPQIRFRTRSRESRPSGRADLGQDSDETSVLDTGHPWESRASPRERAPAGSGPSPALAQGPRSPPSPRPPTIPLRRAAEMGGCRGGPPPRAACAAPRRARATRPAGPARRRGAGAHALYRSRTARALAGMQWQGRPGARRCPSGRGTGCRARSTRSAGAASRRRHRRFQGRHDRRSHRRSLAWCPNAGTTGDAAAAARPSLGGGGRSGMGGRVRAAVRTRGTRLTRPRPHDPWQKRSRRGGWVRGKSRWGVVRRAGRSAGGKWAALVGGDGMASMNQLVLEDRLEL
jgi:hypothetical protein